MKHVTAIVAVLAGLIAGTLPASVSAPVRAQEPAEIVCMAGVTAGRAPGRAILFPVHSSQAGALVAKGFEARPCSREEAQARVQLRADICALAQSAAPAIQQSFEDTYRISPAELCTVLNVGAGN